MDCTWELDLKIQDIISTMKTDQSIGNLGEVVIIMAGANNCTDNILDLYKNVDFDFLNKLGESHLVLLLGVPKQEKAQAEKIARLNGYGYRKVRMDTGT